MKTFLAILMTLLIVIFSGTALPAEQQKDALLWENALKIQQESLVIDSHCDTPLTMMSADFDVGKKSRTGEVDLVRMKEGGVDASVFAVFVANNSPNPARRALEIVDMLYTEVQKNREIAGLAFSPEDIREIHSEGRRALLIGMENGDPLEGSMGLLRDYWRLGVRYITLTHADNNEICDSSMALKPRWRGLSNFGKKLIPEMNRLGMIIDVSHISDDSFRDVVELSRAPVIASHSSVRALCKSPRNLTDDMIRALARHGGVIQINFYSGYLDDGFEAAAEKVRKEIAPEVTRLRTLYKDNRPKYREAVANLWMKNAPPPVSIERLIDHIDYAVKLVGDEYVGLGSDFDGAGSYPEGLQDVSGYPLITYHLLKRGYSEASIKKILGENFLRVFEEVTRVSQKLNRE